MLPDNGHDPLDVVRAVGRGDDEPLVEDGPATSILGVLAVGDREQDLPRELVPSGLEASDDRADAANAALAVRLRPRTLSAEGPMASATVAVQFTAFHCGEEGKNGANDKEW